MTRERAIQRATVQLHWGKGGGAQWKNRHGDWEDLEEHHVWSQDFDVRIKPEPKLRPWRPEEVPVGAIVRCKANRDLRRMILAVEATGVWIACTGLFEFRFLLDHYMLDDGKPCGVEETA